jgi:hypothetical protein
VKRLCLAGISLLALGMIAYLARSGDLSHILGTCLKSYPIVSFPRQLDLGEREFGAIAVGTFTIANQGGGELVLDQIRTNCECSGLEQQENGRAVRLKELRLKAGERAQVAIRLAVRGQAGKPLRSVVFFCTNDPTQPEGRIDVVVTNVTGGVRTWPAAIAFGTIPLGGKATQVLYLHDDAASPRTLARIESSCPSQVKVRPFPPVKTAEGNHDVGLSSVIGTFEVVLETEKPGTLQAEVRAYLVGEQRAAAIIPVTAKVARLVEVIPDSLVLPRTSTVGLLYSGAFLCRNWQGKPFTLEPVSVHPGLTAKILAVDDNPALKIVHIEWEPARDGESVVPLTRLVRLRAQIGQQSTVLEIPVKCRRAETHDETRQP